MIQTVVQIEGKTEQEALEKALVELDAEEEEIEMKVVEKVDGGLFRKGDKKAVLEVSLKEDPLLIAKWILRKMIKIMRIDAKVNIEETEIEDVLMIEGEELAHLIGRGGTTLAQWQYLLHSIVARHVKNYKPFSMDINGYLQRKKKQSIDLAKEAARKVRLTGREVTLKQLSPYQRRIVHITLGSHPDVMTFSVGEGEERNLIVKPK